MQAESMSDVPRILAARLQAVKPSASIAAKARADALKAAGRSIVDFTVGEPDFPKKEEICAGKLADACTEIGL